MDNQEKEKIINRFPLEFQKIYRQAQAGPPHSPGITHRLNDANSKPFIAPLVNKALPNTVVGRPLMASENSHSRNFIHPTTALKNEESKITVENEKLIIGDWTAYYNLVRNDSKLRAEPEVEGFVVLMEKIPHACGCVRAPLTDSAKSQYAQMLPAILTRNPSFFTYIKETHKVSSLIFKEGAIVLLEV